LLQLVHWLKDSPEHVAQSGWQETQFPEELNVLEGQELTHCPFEASKLFAHVKQKLALPEQLVQDEEQAEKIIKSAHFENKLKGSSSYLCTSNYPEERGKCPMDNLRRTSPATTRNQEDNQCTEPDRW
jgi:hypothetical protein